MYDFVLRYVCTIAAPFHVQKTHPSPLRVEPVHMRDDDAAVKRVDAVDELRWGRRCFGNTEGRNVQFGIVRRGAVWRCVVQCNVVQCSVVCCNAAETVSVMSCSVVRCGVAWCGVM